MFDPITLEQIVTLYIDGMAINDIADFLMLSPEDVNKALDHILPHLL